MTGRLHVVVTTTLILSPPKFLPLIQHQVQEKKTFSYVLITEDRWVKKRDIVFIFLRTHFHLRNTEGQETLQHRMPTMSVKYWSEINQSLNFKC